MSPNSLGSGRFCSSSSISSGQRSPIWCRVAVGFFLLGQDLARFVLPQVDQPTFDELVALLRLLRKESEDLYQVGKKLVQISEHAEEVLVELSVDELLEHSNWEHPTQILERPRPDFARLLVACQARQECTPESERAEVDAMTVKVERAVRIAESARVRLEKMRQRRRRKRQR